MQVIISNIHPCLPVRKYWAAGPTGETQFTPPRHNHFFKDTMEAMEGLFYFEFSPKGKF
jgi:hypothetical protein